jgi:signal transduction histidine kinase
MELRRRDGTRMVALLDSNPVFDEAGRYLGALAMVLDVTAPRAAEEERRQLEAALTSSQEQLQHAQKLEAVGLLAGGVAHDFNNLLSVILSYSDLIASGLDSADPLAQDVEEIRLAGERATHLTRQLLAFGRRQVLVPRVVDLNDVVAGVEKMLRRLIREDVAFATRRAERPVKVRVDVHQMEQVLMNLAVNARDAMPGGGSLVIETSEALIDDAFAARHGGLRPGPHACLSVRDTGFGMSQETMKRVFEPFFTTKESGRGTGLGLSVVHGIVQQSGGAVVVKSEPGVGTTFDVYLPALPCADVETEATRRVSDSVRMRGTETVLLVDDDESVRTVARRILERFGYRVLESQTVGDALLIAEREGTLDLLLTDVVMPLMDGRELAGRLRRMRPEMRVVYMSGYADGRIDARGDEHFAFVPKPLTPFGLACSVREVLDAN